MPGSYVSEVFTFNRADTTIDVQSAGGFLEMQLSERGTERLVSGRVVVPEAILSKNQPAIDSTFSGIYFEIVRQVKINFDNRPPHVPAVWEYDEGVFRSMGEPEMVLVKK